MYRSLAPFNWQESESPTYIQISWNNIWGCRIQVFHLVCHIFELWIKGMADLARVRNGQRGWHGCTCEEYNSERKYCSETHGCNGDVVCKERSKFFRLCIYQACKSVRWSWILCSTGIYGNGNGGFLYTCIFLLPPSTRTNWYTAKDKMSDSPNTRSLGAELKYGF